MRKEVSSIPKLTKNFQIAINEITKKLIKHYKPEKIILFGSCAQGKIDEDSDIDILIIKKTAKKRHIDRWMDVRGLTTEIILKRRIPFQPLVLTPKEIEVKCKEEDFFVLEILKRGRVLYERKAG